MDDYIPCINKELPSHLHYEAALTAIWYNPLNAPPAKFTKPEHISVLTNKYWGQEKVKDITFGFMEPTSVEMRNKIDLYANKWGKFSKARFRWSKTSPMVRITFQQEGYWSNVGTDILHVPLGLPTTCFQDFTVNTADSEWERVVPHEFGHVLGCPHEHERQEIIDLLDAEATIRLFMRTQGWSRQEVIEQILTPPAETLMGASPVDVRSIMCYEFPASVTKNRQAIPGGKTFSSLDMEYFGKIYPKDDVVIPPPVVNKDRIITVKADASLWVDGKQV